MKQSEICPDFENLEFFPKVYFFGVCDTKGCWSLQKEMLSWHPIQLHINTNGSENVTNFQLTESLYR